MNKFWRIFIYIGLPISVIGTILCISVVFCRIKELSFDYMGVIVGILSFLITVLVGWNIYSVIDMKNLKEETERRVDKMFQEKTEDYSTKIREQIIDTQIAENINDATFYFQTIQHDNFMRTIANTLYLLHHVDDEEKVKYCVEIVNKYFDKRIGVEYNKAVLDLLKEQLYFFASNRDYVRNLINRIEKQNTTK